MRRFLVIAGILAFSLFLFAPAYSYADTCNNGAIVDADGKCVCTNGATFDVNGRCVCPDGNPAQTDGTCKLDPFAQACNGAGRTSAACQVDGNTSPVSGNNGIILRVINIFSFVIGAASVIMILVGGFRYVISNGNGENISKAKDTILYALIGIVVFLLSRGIISFVINKL